MTAAANGTVGGPYTVTASDAGTDTALFHLTNNAAPTVAVFNFPITGPDGGVYTYGTTTGLQQINPASGSALTLGIDGLNATLLAVGANGDVAAEFQDHGVYLYSLANGWQLLTSPTSGDGGNASLLAIDGGGHAYADFHGLRRPGIPQRHELGVGAAAGHGRAASGRPRPGRLVAGGGRQRRPGRRVPRLRRLATPAHRRVLAAADAGRRLAAGGGRQRQRLRRPVRHLSGVYELTGPTAHVQLTPDHAALLAVDAGGDVFIDQATPGYGVQEYVSGVTWKSVQPSGVPESNGHAGDAALLAADAGGGAVFAEFPGYGVWQIDAGAAAFRQLTVSDPLTLAEDAGANVYADPSGQGVLENASGTDDWQPLTSATPPPSTTPSLMAVDANGDVAAEFQGYGVYLYTQANGWQRLTTAAAALLAIDGSGNVYADLSGALTGVYELTPTSHTQLTPDHAALLAVNTNGYVFADFAGYGVDQYLSGVTWKSVQPPATDVPPLDGHARDATLLAVDANGDLAAEFPGYGVWELPFGTTDWKHLTADDASLLAVDGSGYVFADFAGYGVDEYLSGTTWKSVQPAGVPPVKGHASDATLLTDDLNGDVFAEFPSSGFYSFTAGGFQPVPNMQGDASVLG